MIDRLTFFDSISGVKYPNMLITFFDQFIALKQVVEGSGSISVDSNTKKSIGFNIDFNNKDSMNKALMNINSSTVIIYNRPINVIVDIISDTRMHIKLQ
ncbi:MAG: hypothetical protein HUJ56_07425 [Erysipelotrichaceae bacterium]|nr:hypothetical protein [Erysipelotrichaceae bacterium]